MEILVGFIAQSWLRLYKNKNVIVVTVFFFPLGSCFSCGTDTFNSGIGRVHQCFFSFWTAYLESVVYPLWYVLKGLSYITCPPFKSISEKVQRLQQMTFSHWFSFKFDVFFIGKKNLIQERDCLFRMWEIYVHLILYNHKTIKC